MEDLVEQTRLNFVNEVAKKVNRVLVSYAVAVNKRTRSLKPEEALKVLEEERVHLKKALERRTKRALRANVDLLRNGFESVTEKAGKTVV